MAVDDAANWRASIATFQEGYAGITFLAGLMRDPQLLRVLRATLYGLMDALNSSANLWE